MTGRQMIFTIIIVALGTILTRFLPFIVFNDKKRLPDFIKYLSTVLPYASGGILVVYCLRHLSFNEPYLLMINLSALVFITLIHIWKRNFLLSIIGGTVFYLVLVNFLS